MPTKNKQTNTKTKNKNKKQKQKQKQTKAKNIAQTWGGGTKKQAKAKNITQTWGDTFGSFHVYIKFTCMNVCEVVSNDDLIIFSL